MFKKLFGRLKGSRLFAQAGDATPEDRDATIRRATEFQQILKENGGGPSKKLRQDGSGRPKR